ncbi:MAG TPA: AMP-binding protein, partial [Candidatus Cloacimonadota bacterium]|nr:AMP-binding protein [Candidatus Cloacimonadota bacterium]
RGATIYTVNSSNIKYLDIARVLTSYPISVACLVPSVVSLLRPFLPEINLPKVRTCILTAEATSNSLLNDLRPSIPNADIWNLYGPTEATVWCLAYLTNPHTEMELYHDLISVGHPMPGITALIKTDDGITDAMNEKGELLIGGEQVAWGYVNDEKKNQTVFQMIHHGSQDLRCYYTGDIAFFNEHGNIMYCGRKDHQVKIQGYRIELHEIEYHAKKFTNCNAIAVAKEIKGNTQLFLCVENFTGADEDLISYLQNKLPVYMIPKQVIHYKQFPVNSSSKIDRKKLEHAIES